MRAVASPSLPRRQRVLVEGARVRGIPIASCLTYCHYTLQDRTLLSSGFLDWAAAGGLGVLNASPLAMGMLTQRGPPAWHPAKAHQKAAAARAASLAAAAGIDISTVAMRFAAGCPGVASTLFSVESSAKLHANLRAVLEPAAQTEVRANM